MPNNYNVHFLRLPKPQDSNIEINIYIFIL